MNEQVAQPRPETLDQRGLRCPKCECEHFRVIYTRRTWGGRILRRRECRHCGKRITTFEQSTERPR